MLIDAHAHVDRYDLVDDRALSSALAEIAQHRILTISNSMDLESYRRDVDIGEECDLVVPVFGVHPWNAPEYAGRLQDLERAVESSPMIGEVGLDHYFVKDAAAYPDQIKVLEWFLRAAEEQDKIISLHTKGAEQEVLELLDRYAIRRVVVHWYSGPMDVFQELVARGVYFTVGIEVLHSAHLKAIAQAIPMNRLLTETDNPGGPAGFIGRAGMPALVKDVVRGLAEARRSTVEAVVQAVQANLVQLVGNDPRLAGIRGKLAEGRP